MSAIGYLNGQFLDPDDALIPIDERGYNFGDGIYEVLRVYAGRAFLADWHFERLERSLRAVAIDNPHTREQWIELTNEAIRRSGEAEALVYLQVTRGIAIRSHAFPEVKPSVSMTVRPYPPVEQEQLASLLCLPDERWPNAWIKTINLLPNVIAKETAHRAGADEALLVREGYFTEGSSSNAWFVRDGELWTAPANRYILGGVTRRLIVQLAAKLGLTVREQPIALDALQSVDEVFMSHTGMEVEAAGRVFVDRAALPALRHLPADPPELLVHTVTDPVMLWECSATGPVTGRLMAACRDYVERFRMQEV